MLFKKKFRDLSPLSNDCIDLSELKRMDIKLLEKKAKDINVEDSSSKTRQNLIFEILKKQTEKGGLLYSSGVLEILIEGFGFLRSPHYNYVPGPNDIYVSPSQIKKFNLKKGDTVSGEIRQPRDNERYYALLKIESINYDKVEVISQNSGFDNLTPLFPEEILRLEYTGGPKTGRIIDMFCPIGKGQRSLVVAPPKTGKTTILKHIANSISRNHPEIFLLVLLIDERPEEVTDMDRSVDGEVVSSTFDEPATRHVHVAEMVIEKAKRLVECGKDVVILLDSLTRLARAYNVLAPTSGKVLSGGVDSNALHKPKRFFGAARNIEDGGSLTIIASALVDTGSRMDEVIFEEFKGTGNQELLLSRKLVEKRIFPAVSIVKSSTRREELMINEKELAEVWKLRRLIAAQNNSNEGLEFVLDKMNSYKKNSELLKMLNS